jgi:hypothetical protein
MRGGLSSQIDHGGGARRPPPRCRPAILLLLRCCARWAARCWGGAIALSDSCADSARQDIPAKSALIFELSLPCPRCPRTLHE